MQRLHNQLYISPQVRAEDLVTAARLGIGTLICNRPDGEEAGQPDFAQVRAWAEEAGIRHCIYQPVSAPAINTADAETFAAQLAAANGPVLAYCRTGTRSSLLWALHAAANGTGIADILACTTAAGIDLSPHTARLQAAAAN